MRFIWEVAKGLMVTVGLFCLGAMVFALMRMPASVWAG